MSTSINVLYTLQDKGSTYLYYPRYTQAELATNILHEVVISGPTGRTRADVDFTHNQLMSRSSFLKWIQMGMPDREEYQKVINGKEDNTDSLVPLTASMIDELFEVYKHN